MTGSIAANLRDVQARIAAAALAAGRTPGAVTLVAVSKTHPAEAVREAIAAGQLSFGENRVQEAAAKFGFTPSDTPSGLRAAHPRLRLHLIGPVQTNKARDAVRLADCIESLDRSRLADALDGAAQREGRLPELLIQVNVGNEPQKAGVARAAADGFVGACRARFRERVTGLMCIPPQGVDPRPHFAWLAACAARHGLGVVSMGMSGDYEAAIAEGATSVRVGTAIFGARPPAG